MNKFMRVLIIDDRVNVRRTIKNSLLGLNCTFSEAERGEEALDLIKENNFDVIFLDIKLPDISGIETYKRAIQIRPNLGRVIVLTGYPDTKTAIEAGELGAFDYITKANIDRDKLRDVFIKSSTWEPAVSDAKITDDFVCVRITASSNLEDVYEHTIKPIVESFGLSCRRVDEHKEPKDIACQICGSLQSCKLAIVDIPTMDPNALIEVGLAIGHGKRIVLLRNEDTTMPASLAGIKHVEYSSIDSLKTRLKETLEATLK